MRKFFIIATFVWLIGLVMYESGVLNSLLIFLIAGAIPGTSIVLSPTAMLALLVGIAWLIIMHAILMSTTNRRTVKRVVKTHVKKRASMPKRRYRHI